MRDASTPPVASLNGRSGSAQHDMLNKLLMINEEPDVEALHDFRSRLDELRYQRLNSPDFCIELVEQECASFLRRTRHCSGTSFELPHLLLKMVRKALPHDFGRRERFDCEVAERDSSALG